MEIKALGDTGFDTIYDAFSQAFADYELRLNREQLHAMLIRRGFDSNLSFAAFDGNSIVAFTFNGTGNFNGIPTVYDTGTGTLKEYRGKGLATRIFEYSIPFLKEKGIKQYLLEVLQHNTKAVSVYKNLGFETTREFNYFMQKNEEVRNEIRKTDFALNIGTVEIEKLNSVSGFRDFYPSWQNDFESIKRAGKEMICLGAFAEKRLAGYGIFESTSGDITQIAVNKQLRRKGIASLLLREMLRLNKHDSVKIVNTDVACNSIIAFLKAKNIHIKGKQFEMIRTI